jgi:hypothetical protein
LSEKSVKKIQQKQIDILKTILLKQFAIVMMTHIEQMSVNQKGVLMKQKKKKLSQKKLEFKICSLVFDYDCEKM